MITSVLSELTAFTSRGMMESVYTSLFYLMLCLAPLVFVILLWVPAPYGRYVRPGWGPIVNNRLGWFFMESPASLLMLIPFYFIYENIVVCIFLFIWQFHYVHRAFFYPFTLKSERNMPFLIIVMAFFFNVVNAYLNGFYLILNEQIYPLRYLLSWNFVLGASLFLMGFLANKESDRLLRNSRKSNPVGKYQIPDKFLYRFISCPNYFSESIQWLGWAIMVMAPPGWLFFFWTLANLLPRAISHHNWYRENLRGYPKTKKAFLPFIL